MTLPNFILAGAPKSGSSSLAGYLRQHPDIFLSRQKELFFFDFNYDKGLDWYRAHFADADGQSAIGEATVWYMRWPSVPERMASVIPNAKLLFLLRNPIDRAYSNWCHEMRDGRHPPHESFDTFLTRHDRDSRTIISSGYYDVHFDRWLKHFDRSQMWIGFYDDMINNQRSILGEIFTFLDVADCSSQIDISKKDNVAWWFSRTWILWTASTLLTPVTFAIGRDPVELAWRRSRHVRQLFFDRSKRPPKISASARVHLRDHYKPHNDRLEALIGCPLPRWT